MVQDNAEYRAILATLRASGKRVTAAKRLVAEVFVTTDEHLTAEEITRRVQSREPDVSLSTVYRILEEFEELGIVVHSHFAQQAAVHHLAGIVHGHLTCEVCSTTTEIPAVHFDALAADLRATYGFSLDRHHVSLTGTCAECRGAETMTS